MIESGRFSLFSRGTANEKAGLVPLGEEQCPAYFSSLRRDTLKSLSGHVRGPCRADWRSLKYAYCETFYASSCCRVNARFWCNCSQAAFHCSSIEQENEHELRSLSMYRLREFTLFVRISFASVSAFCSLRVGLQSSMADEKVKQGIEEIQKPPTAEDFITNWPLNTPFEFESYRPPSRISFHCDGPECGKETTWVL